VSLNIITAMDHYTRYYVLQSGGGGNIGPLYKPSFGFRGVMALVHSSGVCFVSLSPCCIRVQKLLVKRP
jgi:hypothetical protein